MKWTPDYKREYMRTYMRKLLAARREADACMKCGGDRTDRHTACLACRVKRSLKRRKQAA